MCPYPDRSLGVILRWAGGEQYDAWRAFFEMLGDHVGGDAWRAFLEMLGEHV
jgi:hypothetical protein